MTQGFSNRQIGVRGMQTSTERAPADTVVKMEKVETYVVYYGDESGRAVIDTFVKVGGKWMAPSNGQMWAGSLKSVTSHIAKQLEEKIAAETPGVVPRDAVDVMDEKVTK